MMGDCGDKKDGLGSGTGQSKKLAKSLSLPESETQRPWWGWSVGGVGSGDTDLLEREGGRQGLRNHSRKAKGLRKNPFY